MVTVHVLDTQAGIWKQINQFRMYAAYFVTALEHYSVGKTFLHLRLF